MQEKESEQVTSFLISLFEKLPAPEHACSDSILECFDRNASSAGSKSIRCVCRTKKETDDLIQCILCKNYLHKSCLYESIKTDGFVCQVCRYQRKEIDPFQQFNSYNERLDKSLYDFCQLLNKNRDVQAQLINALTHLPPTLQEPEMFQNISKVCNKSIQELYKDWKTNRISINKNLEGIPSELAKI